MFMTYQEIKNNKEINIYIEQADKSLEALGYTEHSFAHVTKVANDAALILSSLGYNEHDIELAKIAGYMHDIGNLINRIDHSQSGAIMAFQILKETDLSPEDISLIVSSIGNHDEGTGVAVNHIAAALIIADKSDVRCTRVRKDKCNENDIHYRVNYSVKSSSLTINRNEITLSLEIDTRISSVIDYFEIFLGRMKMCKNAAEKLNMQYKLIINNQMLM
ncbi:MAG: HD domain-containing protein [Anaeroplasma sp.]